MKLYIPSNDLRQMAAFLDYAAASLRHNSIWYKNSKGDLVFAKADVAARLAAKVRQSLREGGEE